MECSTKEECIFLFQSPFQMTSDPMNKTVLLHKVMYGFVLVFVGSVLDAAVDCDHVGDERFPDAISNPSVCVCPLYLIIVMLLMPDQRFFYCPDMQVYSLPT